MDDNFKLYDRLQKQILKHKLVIALIISICFKEFSSISIQDLANNYLSENNESNQPILLGEDSEINLLDRQVRFDSLLKIKFPDGRIGYINIEIQNDGRDLKNIIGRSFTYSGVLITIQIGIEIVDSHYENLKKTASLWLISNGPAKYEGCVIHCFIEQKNIIGEAKFNYELIDFFNNVYIFLTKNSKIESEEMKVLSALLNPYMDHQVRKEILKNREEYSILYQEVLDMEGNGRAIYEKGRTDVILELLKHYLDLNYTFKQAAKVLFLNEEEQTKYHELLEK